jgi:hypothetical protein
MANQTRDLPADRYTPSRKVKIGDDVLCTIQSRCFGLVSRPAKVVHVWNQDMDLPNCVQLAVFIDGNNDFDSSYFNSISPVMWLTSVSYDREPGYDRKWRFMEE